MQGTVDYFRTGVKVALAMFVLSGLTSPCLTAALQRQNPSCHRQPPPRRSAAAYPHLAMITASATLARPKARYKPLHTWGKRHARTATLGGIPTCSPRGDRSRLSVRSRGSTSSLFFTFPDLRTRRWLRLHARVVVLRVLQGLCVIKSRCYSQYGGRL
jgi:hypothetical protein